MASGRDSRNELFRSMSPPTDLGIVIELPHQVQVLASAKVGRIEHGPHRVQLSCSPTVADRQWLTDSG